MSVYLNAATGQFGKIFEKRTALLLGQAVQLPYFKAFDEPLLSLEKLYDYLDAAIQDCLQQAGWSANELPQIPILLGSTAYVISDCETRLAADQPLPEQHSLTCIADVLAERYQTQVFSFATSCTSAAQAIGYGYKMLKVQQAQKVLVLGFEMFNRLTFEHFHAMNLLAQTDDYLPFVQPNGIVLGEGAGCVALSTQPNAQLPCEMLAISTLTDNDNLTNSSATALQSLIEQCLCNANLQPSQIDGVKVHGVGGQFDEAEQAVLRQTLPQADWILAKPFVGHTLGASGALETAFLWNALQQGELPSLPCQSELPLAHHKPFAPAKCGTFLNYFLGFGGSHIAWILKVGQCA